MHSQSSFAARRRRHSGAQTRISDPTEAGCQCFSRLLSECNPFTCIATKSARYGKAPSRHAAWRVHVSPAHAAPHNGTGSIFSQYSLHLKFRARKIKATLEILALPAVFPCIRVSGQLAVSLTWPNRVDTDLKNFPNQPPAELELLQIGVNIAKACLLHIFLCS